MSWNLTAVEGLTKKQRRTMMQKNLGRVGKKNDKRRKAIGSGYTKNKYWCPNEKSGYLAMKRHIRCKLCYENELRKKKGKIHDPILFDKKKNHTW